MYVLLNEVRLQKNYLKALTYICTHTHIHVSTRVYIYVLHSNHRTKENKHLKRMIR